MFCFLSRRLENCTKLKTLNLKDNRLTELPSVLYKLVHLESLDISMNVQLKRIEPDILLLKSLQKLMCSGNDSLHMPPSSVCQQGVDAVRKFFTDLGNDDGSKMTRVPVAVVGQVLSGKTSLIRSLQRGGRELTFRDESSDMDEATELFQLEDLELNDSCVKLLDYGGHQVYHIAYQLLRKEGCVPLFVVNMKEFVDLTESRGVREATRRVCFDWIAHLYLACPQLGSPILVMTHVDQLAHPEENRKALLETSETIRRELHEEEKQCSRNLANNLSPVVHLANTQVPLFSEDDIYEFSNDLSETRNLELLKRNLNDRCKEFSIQIPRLWEQVGDFVEQQSEKPFVLVSTVKAKFKNDDPLTILRYMHNSGTVFWFEDLPDLSDYVFHQIPAITDMITLLFHHSSSKQWEQRVQTFKLFRHKRQDIGILRYKSFVDAFTTRGVLDEALLFHLLRSSKFSNDVAVKLLKCFHIIHGPIKHEKRDAFILPSFAAKFMSDSWQTDGHVQLRLDLILGGLSLPRYVFQLVTVAVLNLSTNDCSTLKVTRNGATVRNGENAIHVVHDYNDRKVSLQASTTVEMLGRSWQKLLELAKHILALLSSVWKACRVEVLVYCARCLFLRTVDPGYDVDPEWFCRMCKVDVDSENDDEEYFENGGRDETPNFSGLDLVYCKRCSTSVEELIPTVPKPLKYPCEYICMTSLLQFQGMLHILLNFNAGK